MRLFVLCVISLLGILISCTDGYGAMGYSGFGIGGFVGLIIFVGIFYVMIKILNELRDDDDHKGHDANEYGTGHGMGHGDMGHGDMGRGDMYGKGYDVGPGDMYDTGYGAGHGDGYGMGHDGDGYGMGHGGDGYGMGHGGDGYGMGHGDGYGNDDYGYLDYLY